MYSTSWTLRLLLTIMAITLATPLDMLDAWSLGFEPASSHSATADSVPEAIENALNEVRGQHDQPGHITASATNAAATSTTATSITDVTATLASTETSTDPTPTGTTSTTHPTSLESAEAIVVHVLQNFQTQAAHLSQSPYQGRRRRRR